MSRYIDADALKKAVYRSGIDNQADISTLIEDQPTADVVEVVRCKDCKHYREENFHCWLMRGKMSLNDYCSYGERREG